MAFKRPWLEFSLGWSDENAVYWWLFEVILRGRGWRESQIETFLTSSGWIQPSGIWERERKMSECHNHGNHFRVLVFMLPVLAQSFSSELKQLGSLSKKNTCVLYVEQEVSSLTYWFTSMFLSNTPRTISTGLVFWDWEGLLRWCKDMDWGKGRCKVIILNTSFHIWDGNRHLMGFVNRLVKSMVLRKSKSLLGKFIHQDRV